MSAIAKLVLENPVRVEDGAVALRFQGEARRWPLMALPDRCVEWMEQGRRATYDKLALKGGAHIPFAHHHLPVLVTSGEGEFPFNCSNKGVGLLPKPEYLKHYTTLFQSVLDRTAGRPWQETLQERIQAVSRFYFNREAVDYRCLTTLEIFEKNTFRNLVRNPVASLHYTGNAPDYMSFQVNCAVEVIGPEDPRHAFIRLARVMFEFDNFHIAQHEFPYAYLLWVTGVQDKTPFRVPEKEGKVVPLKTHGGLEWDPEAIASVNRAPGMIRQFITEQIEKYARRRGFTRVDMRLVREAREVMERPGEGNASAEPGGAESPAADLKPHGKIYVGLDSSPLADAAADLAVRMGKACGSKLFGSHVYAAKMHDNRFRAMEGGLPAQFQEEKELEKQRKIHDNLITKGLELITDSYLEVMARGCEREGLEYTPVSLEGKNWQKLVEDINAHDYDLIAFGGFGIGRVGRTQLGSVTERTLRRVRRDFLVVKKPWEENTGDAVVVCLDGSERSWGGFYRGLALAKAFGKRVVAVSAFDPYFHYAMFKSLNKALTDKARKVFKFEEQEKLHEDIIDSGLAKIYQSYLNIAARLAEKEGVAVETRLLDGKPFEKILQFAESVNPWLLVLGRIGFHSEEDMDLGSNTENVLRQCACNVLVAESKAKPPMEYQAEETVAWTVEAKARLEGIPAMAKPMAMKAIQNYCVAEGHTVVTESILNEALKAILPPEMLARMGINLEAKREAEAADLDAITLAYRCPVCGYVHSGHRPQSCPVCGREGAVFKLLEGREAAGGEEQAALGSRTLRWDQEALAALDAIPGAFEREQIRNRVEKRAFTEKASLVTPEMVRSAQQVSHHASATAAAAPHPEPAARKKEGRDGESLAWTEEAVARLDKVPAGFMRHAAKSTVEKFARAQGHAAITLEVVEGGLGKAREMMQQAVTEKMGAAPQEAEPGSWECHLCGLVADGPKPAACEGCGTGHFRPLRAEALDKLGPSARQKLEWDGESLRRLERVPEGFMRRMTLARVEKWARAHGHSRVDFSVMGDKFDSWAEGSSRHEPGMPWSPEALERANRIPGFIRGIVMREIERHAKSAGLASVDGESMGKAMEHWGRTGNFHGEHAG